MHQLVSISDGGKVYLPFNGQLHLFNQVIIRVSKNEAAPVDHIAYCNPNHKESIIKYLISFMEAPE